MNSEAIYESCKSATLITSFNHLGLCISYQELMRHQTDMATYSVESSKDTVPFPSHFNSSMFTMAAFDDFDHTNLEFLKQVSYMDQKHLILTYHANS